MSCPGYNDDPPCKTIRKLSQKQQQKPPEPTGEDCPLCGKPLVLRQGAYGEFVSCSGYPKCKYVKQNLIEGMKCPKCGEGDIAERKARRGNVFWGCTNYPKCDFTSNYKPVAAEVPGMRQSVPGREDAQERHLPRVPEQEEGRRGRSRAEEARKEGRRARTRRSDRLHLLQAHRRRASSANRRNPRPSRRKGRRHQGTAAGIAASISIPRGLRAGSVRSRFAVLAVIFGLNRYYGDGDTHGTNARDTR